MKNENETFVRRLYNFNGCPERGLAVSEASLWLARMRRGNNMDVPKDLTPEDFSRIWNRCGSY